MTYKCRSIAIATLCLIPNTANFSHAGSKDPACPPDHQSISTITLPSNGYRWIFDESNSYGYATLENGSLAAFDITDIHNPILNSTISIPQTGAVEFLHITDQTLYLFQDSSYHIVDITQPHAPTYTQTTLLTHNDPLQNAVIFKNHIYLGYQDATTEIHSISNPLNPEPLTVLNGVHGLLTVIDGTPISTQGQAYDLTDPINPLPIGTPFTTHEFFYAYQLNDTLFVSRSNSFTGQRIDISKPLSPTSIGDFRAFTPKHGMFANHASILLSIDPEEYYLTTNDLSHPTVDSEQYRLEHEPYRSFQQIHTFDGYTLTLSDHTIHIEQLETYPTYASHHTKGPANDIAILNNHAFVTNNGGSVQAFDISTPNNPKLVSTFNFPNDAVAIDIKDHVAYIATHRDGLNIIDISDPTNLSLLSNINIARRAQDTLVSGNTLYFLDRFLGLYIFNITNPSTPKLISHLSLAGWAHDIIIDQERQLAFISYEQDHVKVIDIANSQNPVYIDDIEDIDNPDSMTIQDNLLYITASYDGYIIVDIDNYKETGHLLQFDQFTDNYGGNTGSTIFAHDIEIIDDMLYIANGTGGFNVMYNANPFNPLNNQFFQSRANSELSSTRRFIIHEGLIYTAVLDGGLRIYKPCELRICPIDFNQNYTLDSHDAFHFMDLFRESEVEADLNGDGSVDFFDISVFFDFFTSSCPGTSL